MAAALAPEEFELVIPEEVANLLQVAADLDDTEIFHTIHLANIWGLAEDIQETCVKVFNYIAEFAKSGPLAAKANWSFELRHYIGLVPFTPGMLRPCQCSIVPFEGNNSLFVERV